MLKKRNLNHAPATTLWRRHAGHPAAGSDPAGIAWTKEVADRRNSQNAENSGTGSCPPVDTRQHKGNGESNGSRGTSLIEPARVTTDFAALPDGAFLELVRPENSAWNDLKFLVWNAGRSWIVDCFEHDGRLLVPPKLDERLHRNLNL
jgi:hypothetical protein